MRLAFDLPATFDAMSRAFSERAQRALPSCRAPELTRLLAQAAELRPRDEWLAGIGAALAGKPVAAFRDQDVVMLEPALAAARVALLSLEHLLEGVDPTSPEASRRVRLSLSRAREPTCAVIADWEPASESKIDELRMRLQDAAKQAPVPRAVALAALARLACEMAEVPARRA